MERLRRGEAAGGSSSARLRTTPTRTRGEWGQWGQGDARVRSWMAGLLVTGAIPLAFGMEADPRVIAPVATPRPRLNVDHFPKGESSMRIPIPKGPIPSVLAALVATGTGVLVTPESVAAQSPEYCVRCKVEDGRPPDCVRSSWGNRRCKVKVGSPSCDVDKPPFPGMSPTTCIARPRRMAALSGVASGVATDNGWPGRGASASGSAACDIAPKRHYSLARTAEIRAGLQRVTI